MGLTDVVKQLSEEERERVEDALSGLENSPGIAEKQLAENIKAEQLLPDGDFATVLRAFAREALTDGDLAYQFDKACRNAKLRGPVMGGIIPTVLGRATDLPRLCSWISDKNPSIPLNTVERLVRLYAVAGRSRAPKAIKTAPLGRHVIWATFSNPDRDTNPFADPLKAKEDIGTSLGLGGLDINVPWVLLVYRPQCQRKDLRIPTVADAGNYAYFRPVQNTTPAPEHGWTEPLSPNPVGLPGQPEIVHSDTVAYELDLPLLILE